MSRNVKGPLRTGPSTGGPLLRRASCSVMDSPSRTPSQPDTSRMSLVVHYLMPWLRDRGSPRGLKCALVDHPITAPKQVIRTPDRRQTANQLRCGLGPSHREPSTPTRTTRSG